MHTQAVFNMSNQDGKTVAGFGDEWERFDQSELDPSEHLVLFNKYFDIFPWHALSPNSTGFDMGCGSGRWAKVIADRVGTLHCLDPSSALAVARKNLSDKHNCIFHNGGVGDAILPLSSMDFGYSLGVLHHVPNTQQGINECVSFLKPGAPFLIYLYYSFDNRPVWFRVLWKTSELIRKVVSKLPHSSRYWASQLIALLVYWPLAKFAWLAQQIGFNDKFCDVLPLGAYRNLSFYTMRTDALDRFGTQLEQRFSRLQIESMLKRAGLVDIKFSHNIPYWCAVGFKA
jgi:SAM-dependent methyltransferase